MKAILLNCVAACTAVLLAVSFIAADFTAFLIASMVLLLAFLARE